MATLTGAGGAVLIMTAAYTMASAVRIPARAATAIGVLILSLSIPNVYDPPGCMVRELDGADAAMDSIS